MYFSGPASRAFYFLIAYPCWNLGMEAYGFPLFLKMLLPVCYFLRLRIQVVGFPNPIPNYLNNTKLPLVVMVSPASQTAWRM